MNLLLNSLRATELRNSTLLVEVFLLKFGQFLLGFLHLAHQSLLVRYHTAYIYISLRPRTILYGKRGNQDILSKREITLWGKKNAACSHVNSFHMNFLLIIQIFMSREVLSTQGENFFSHVSVATRRHCEGLLLFIFEEIASNFNSRWQCTLKSNCRVMYGIFVRVRKAIKLPNIESSSY
jgi:hypothetical protein